MLRLDDHYIWDSWVADDGDLYHLFFLQAPRSLGTPAKRHLNAVVGHATSQDLIDWDYHGICFGPAESGWDDVAIWTGSVISDGDQWRMFYTAVNSEGHGVYDQRIGSAVSDDLQHWTRVGTSAAIPPDPRWYKTLLLQPPPHGEIAPYQGRSETWRDPLIVPDPAGNGWHVLICARSAFAGRNDDGVIAHAFGLDLDHLEVGPPLCQPGQGFGQLEVLQNKQIDGRWVLVFTCHPQEMTDQRKTELGECCTWSLPSPGPLGPWDISLARGFTAEPDLFAAPLVQQRNGSWALVGFRNLEPKGIDAFEILDPIPVALDDEGYLVAR